MEKFFTDKFKSDAGAHAFVGALGGVLGIVAYRYLPSVVARWALAAFMLLGVMGVVSNLIAGAMGQIVLNVVIGATIGFLTHLLMGNAEYRKVNLKTDDIKEA